VVERFNEIGEVCLIHMSGGEPFMYPGFVDMCEALTREHYISINTNLSLPTVREFADRIVSDRVIKITAAIHIQERERHGIDPRIFVDDVEYLASRGFHINALYVMYPPLFDRAQTDIARMRDHATVDVQAKVFKGVYQGKRYPEAYTNHERDKILSLSGGYKFNDKYLTLPLTFQGRSCSAGVRSFKIMVTGDVRRCASVAETYGNLYAGTFSPAVSSEPCTARRILVMSQCDAYLEENNPDEGNQ